MAKPSVYNAPIAVTNSSVQNGNGNAKNGGKAKPRYPHTPNMPNKTSGGGGGAVKHRAYTPGGPTGS